MDDINLRLKQLEALEAHLYVQRQGIMQGRQREDEDLELRRQHEDQDYLKALEVRDQEEDELRQKRRALSRASFADILGGGQSQTLSATIEPIKGPATRSRTKAQRASTAPNSQNQKNKGGLPTGFDGRGKPLFTRVSDGKLVYLECYVEGCSRTSFATVDALRFHVCAPLGHHKIEGLFTGYDHAVELCGKVAPGQERFDTAQNIQSNGLAPTANTRSGFLTPEASNSDSNDSDNGQRYEARAQASVRSVRESGSSSQAVGITDLGRAYRTSSTHPRNSKGTRTRGQRAAEMFDGYLSSDSSNEEAGEINTPITHRIDQHAVKKGRPTSVNRLLVGAELYDMFSEAESQRKEQCTPAVANPVIKDEGGASPPLSLEELPRAPIWSSNTSRFLSAVDPERRVPTGKESMGGWVGTSQTRKRAVSSLPSTPLSGRKRLRSSSKSQSV